MSTTTDKIPTIKNTAIGLALSARENAILIPSSNTKVDLEGNIIAEKTLGELYPNPYPR